MNLRNINIQSLKYFEVLARYEHFTNAANELFISQSTLSKAILALEADLGVELFEKQGRNVRLTRAGKLLRDYVSTGMDIFQSGLEQIQRISDPHRGKILIGSTFMLSSDFIPNTISDFMKNNPEIYISIEHGSNKQILQQLDDGDLDLGICSYTFDKEDYDLFESEFLYEDELCLAVPGTHRLANRESITLDEIKDEIFVGYGETSGMAKSIRMILERNKIDWSPHYIISTPTPEAYVCAGCGVAIVSGGWGERLYAHLGLHYLKILKPYFSRSFSLVWSRNRDLSPPSKALKYHILSAIQFNKP